MDKKELIIILPNHLRGRSLTEKVIPTVSNLRNMLKNLEKEGWDYLRLTNWDKRSYKAYKIEDIEEIIKNKDESEKKSIIREHILKQHPSDMGASCIDIYLVAYASEMDRKGKDNFFKFVFKNKISDKENSAQAIWQVGKGDGEYLGILNSDGTIKDWNFIIKWIKG